MFLVFGEILSVCCVPCVWSILCVHCVCVFGQFCISTAFSEFFVSTAIPVFSEFCVFNLILALGELYLCVHFVSCAWWVLVASEILMFFVSSYCMRCLHSVSCMCPVCSLCLVSLWLPP